MYSIRTLLVSLVILLSFVSLGEAYEHKYSEKTGRIYHWKREKLPVKIDVDQLGAPNVAFSDVQQAIIASVKTWNSVGCALTPLLKVNQVKQGITAPKRDGINLIKFIKKADEWKFSAGEVANTVHYYNLSTGEIVETDLVLNAWNFKWSVNGAADAFDIQATITHEMGHILGLGHSKDPNACMYATANTGETNKRNLNSDDIKGICNIYPKQPCTEGEVIGKDRFCYNGRLTPICPEYHQTCKKCQVKADCRGSKNFCLNLRDGQFCTFDCSATKTCPNGYNCRPIQGDNHAIIGYNCVPKLTQCTNAPAFPCCRNNDDCLPPYRCVGGQCTKGVVCIKEGEICGQNQPCCGNLKCINDGIDSRCRTLCDPLAPSCPGNLRCAFLQGGSGACVPPNNGGREGAPCDDKHICEYQLQCHPRDKKCYLLCRPSQKDSCPLNYRCIKQTDTYGLCEKDTGGKPCKTYGDCATGQVCRNKQCASCQSSAECPPHHRCKAGACLAECSDSSTCPRRHSCVAGLCEPSQACVYDKDCPTGLTCQQGVCRASSKKCSSNADCQGGEICDNGACIDPCNNSCKADQVCLKRRCVPKVCVSDAQCGEGLECFASKCREKILNCGGQGPCPQGHTCVQGKCKAGIGYGCKGNDDCVSGLCATGGKHQFCSQTCSLVDPHSCPDKSTCAELPNIGLGCWPTTFSKCENGKCVPLTEGCGCNTTNQNPDVGVSILSLIFLLLFVRRFYRKDGR